MTSSGIDPRELFDDMKNTEDLKDTEPHLITTDIDDIAKDCQEIDQRNVTSDIDALLTEVPKRYMGSRSRHFEGNLDSNFNQALDAGSIYTTPSMYSLISMPNISSCARIDLVTDLFFITEKPL